MAVLNRPVYKALGVKVCRLIVAVLYMTVICKGALAENIETDLDTNSEANVEGNVHRGASTLASDLLVKLSMVKTLEANFKQTTIDASGETLQASEGSLYISTKARFRIETRTPFAQTLVSNGISFWSYDVDLEQVVVSHLLTDINQVPILLFGNTDPSLLESYRISFFQSDELDHYVLEPLRADSLFKSLIISFHSQIPTSIAMQDSLGQMNKLVFQIEQMNGLIPDAVFEFEVPANTDVIDERI